MVNKMPGTLVNLIVGGLDNQKSDKQEWEILERNSRTDFSVFLGEVTHFGEATLFWRSDASVAKDRSSNMIKKRNNVKIDSKWRNFLLELTEIFTKSGVKFCKVHNDKDNSTIPRTAKLSPFYWKILKFVQNWTK